MSLLAEGILREQDPGGGLHALLNDRTTPLETTGTAMFAKNKAPKLRAPAHHTA